MESVVDYIKHYDGVMSKDTTNKIVDYYYQNAPWKKSSFSVSEGLSPESSKKVLMNEYWIKKGDMYREDLKNTFYDMVSQYIKVFTKIIPENFSQYRLNHYPEGGFMKNHIDNIHHSHGQQFGYPHITALLFLNDDYEGGEIVLADGLYTAPKKQVQV